MTMFEKILAAIIDTATIEVGCTSYLDTAPWSNPVKGICPKGRPFFSLPMEIVELEQYIGEPERKKTCTGMTTFFQRYTDDKKVWVTAKSHSAGAASSPILSGAVSDPDNGNTEELLLQLLQGETVTFIWSQDWDYKVKYTRICRLLTPAEVEKREKMPRKESFPKYEHPQENA
jgi:hypothetical protein